MKWRDQITVALSSCDSIRNPSNVTKGDCDWVRGLWNFHELRAYPKILHDLNFLLSLQCNRVMFPSGWMLRGTIRTVWTHSLRRELQGPSLYESHEWLSTNTNQSQMDTTRRSDDIAKAFNEEILDRIIGDRQWHPSKQIVSLPGPPLYCNTTACQLAAAGGQSVYVGSIVLGTLQDQQLRHLSLDSTVVVRISD